MGPLSAVLRFLQLREPAVDLCCASSVPGIKDATTVGTSSCRPLSTVFKSRDDWVLATPSHSFLVRRLPSRAPVGINGLLYLRPIVSRWIGGLAAITGPHPLPRFGITVIRPLQLLFDISTGSMARHRWAGITMPRPLELLVDRNAVFIGGVTSLSVALPFL